MYTVDSILDCPRSEYVREMIPWLVTFMLAVLLFT